MNTTEIYFTHRTMEFIIKAIKEIEVTKYSFRKIRRNSTQLLWKNEMFCFKFETQHHLK